MTDPDCIFCRIAAGEIPSDTIYEDSDFRVILDLNPASKGHALILPKSHAKDLFELDEEIAAKAVKTAKKVAPALMKAVNADGLNLVQNNGEAAGQTVSHFHMHLIPRFKGAAEIVVWEPGKSDKETQQQIVEAVKANLQ